jgi:hypothetical protein
MFSPSPPNPTRCPAVTRSGMQAQSGPKGGVEVLTTDYPIHVGCGSVRRETRSAATVSYLLVDRQSTLTGTYREDTEEAASAARGVPAGFPATGQFCLEWKYSPVEDVDRGSIAGCSARYNDSITSLFSLHCYNAATLQPSQAKRANAANITNSPEIANTVTPYPSPLLHYYAVQEVVH